VTPVIKEADSLESYATGYCQYIDPKDDDLKKFVKVASSKPSEESCWPSEVNDNDFFWKMLKVCVKGMKSSERHFLTSSIY